VRDLADIDRTLGELGQASSDVKGLLQRALGAERTLARLDALLGDLAPGEQPGPPSEPPPKRFGRHARWAKPAAKVDARARKPEPERKPEPARVPEPARAQEPTPEHESVPPAALAPQPGRKPGQRSTLVGIPSNLPLPMRSEQQQPALAPDEPELSMSSEDTDPELELAPAAEPEENTETGSWQRPEQNLSAARVLGFDEPRQSPAEDSDEVTRIAVAPDGENETTRHMRSLLDQQLDPNDFPDQSSEHPQAAGTQAEDSEDDFELLIEDDEILEIEELDEE